jgi:hypothetical protein
MTNEGTIFSSTRGCEHYFTVPGDTGVWRLYNIMSATLKLVDGTVAPHSDLIDVFAKRADWHDNVCACSDIIYVFAKSVDWHFNVCASGDASGTEQATSGAQSTGWRRGQVQQELDCFGWVQLLVLFSECSVGTIENRCLLGFFRRHLSLGAYWPNSGEHMPGYWRYSLSSISMA